MIGLHIMRPTSIVVAGGGSESASVRADGGVDFANATSLSLNGVFTADYDNYMISMRWQQTVGDRVISLRLRASGTDNSTASSYVAQFLNATSTTVSGSRATGTDAGFSNSGNDQRNGVTAYLYGPYLAQPTAGRSIPADSELNAYFRDYAFTHNQSTSYDGFSLILTADTFSGVVTVYGYAQ